jgi:hypothetical protein
MHPAHHENKHQQSVNDSWSFIIEYLGAKWLNIVINVVFASSMGKKENQMPNALT